MVEAKANLRSTRIEIEALTQATKGIGQTPADQQTVTSMGSLGFLSDLIEIEPGYEKAFKEDKNFLEGLNVFKGQVTYKAVAEVFAFNYVSPDKALANV